MILLTPCKQRLVNYVVQDQRLNFFKKCDIGAELPKKLISEENLKTDCGVNNRPFFAPMESIEA